MISFIIVIKNRTKFEVKIKEKKIKLELFKNNIESLMGLHREGELWEFVVVDFKSTDVDMPSFLDQQIKRPGCSHKCISVDGAFSKGKGLNIGFNNASHDILFFLDADMMIKTRKLFEDISLHVEQNDTIMFPVCYSYHNASHNSGWIRSSGVGNAIYKKSHFEPYFENKRWGNEDAMNYRKLSRKNKIIRNYYGEDFVHQWHPNGTWFKNIYYNS
jgi:glycosyltransferase involved in cell wall biosynthesis